MILGKSQSIPKTKGNWMVDAQQSQPLKPSGVIALTTSTHTCSWCLWYPLQDQPELLENPQ